MDIQWPDWRSVKKHGNERKLENEPRRLIAFELLSASTEVGGMAFVNPRETPDRGVHFAVVYESDLPRIRSKVRTPEATAAVARAKVVFEKKLEILCKDHKTTREEILANHAISWPEVLAETDPDFRKNGPGCLGWLVVSDEVIPAPDTPESRGEAQMANLARVLEQAIKAAAGKQAKAAT